MILLSIALLCTGLVLIVVGAEEAIKRLLNLARFLHLSEFVISFVLAGVIAILPELTIGVLAAVGGTSSLGFGVILGANVADLTLVIGVVVLTVGKLQLDSSIMKNVQWSLLAVILPVLLFFDGEISRIDGVILVAAFLIYVFYLLRTKHDTAAFTGKRSKRRVIFEAALLFVSLALLFVGGSLITENSQQLSITLGLPLFVVGLIVAVGTCLPEMIFAIRSCNRMHCGLGLGNILGNVLADSLLTIGIIALIQPIKPELPISPLSTGVFMAVSAGVVYLLSRDGSLSRRDGVLLTALYGVFIVMQLIIESYA